MRLSCAADVPSPFIRIRATLTEHDATPAAGASATALAKHVAVSSFQTAATGCTAGGTVDVPIPFGPQQGTFMPGRAEIVGFAAASFPYEGFLAFGPTTVIVRPD